MLTDAPPRNANRTGFLASDRIRALDLPQNGPCSQYPSSRRCRREKRSMCAVPARSFWQKHQSSTESRHAASACSQPGPCESAKTGRGNCSGTTTPETLLIRVWMRTAVRKEVTSFGTFLSTLSHELCHHLDYQQFGFSDSWHTRGFYERTAAIYHHARGTSRKRLFWAAVPGERWRIDWQRTNRGV
jgi:hypothetical protein